MNLSAWFHSLPEVLKKYIIVPTVTSVIICTGFYFKFIQPSIGPNSYVSTSEVNGIIEEKTLKESDVEAFLSGKYKLVTSNEYEELINRINDLEDKLYDSMLFSEPTFLGELEIIRNEFISKDNNITTFVNEWNASVYKGLIRINDKGIPRNAIGYYIPHKDFSSDEEKLTKSIQYSLNGKYDSLSFKLGTDDWNSEKYHDGLFDLLIASDKKGTLFNQTGLKFDSYISEVLDVSECDKLDIMITTYKGKTTTLNVVLSDVFLYKNNNEID